MRRGIQPEILSTFETILPEHGDLEEYLQSVFRDDSRAARNASSSYNSLVDADLGFDAAHLDRATVLSFLEAQNQYTLATEQNNRPGNLSWNNSLNSELDAAIALSLEESEEVDEPIVESLPLAADDASRDMTSEQLESLEEAVGTESGGLSKELLDSFPVQKLEAKSGWFSSNKNDPESCPICLDEYEVGSMLLTLPCLHLYHESCIKECLKCLTLTSYMQHRSHQFHQ